MTRGDLRRLSKARVRVSGVMGYGLGLRVEGSGFRVWGLGFRVQGCRVHSFRVKGLGFMV